MSAHGVAEGAEAGDQDPAARLRAEFDVAWELIAPALATWISVMLARAGGGRRIEPFDVLQEVALRTWRLARDECGLSQHFRPRAFVTARNVIYEVLRSTFKATPAAVDVEGLPESVTRISRRIMRAEAHALLAQVVASLDADDQRLVCLRLEGKSHADIGSIMGVGEAVARKRWQRLREKLDGLLRAAGLDPEP